MSHRSNKRAASNSRQQYPRLNIERATGTRSYVCFEPDFTLVQLLRRVERDRVRPRESRFSFIPRADLRRSPDKRAASRGTARMLAFSLPRHALSFSCSAPAHTVARQCTESCDLDGNFCEAPTKLLLSWLTEMYSFSYDYHFFRAKYFRTHTHIHTRTHTLA